MVRKDIEHHQAIFDAAACGNLVTENYLLAVVMHACVEEERTGIATARFTHHRIRCRSATARLEDGPTGKTARHFLHVFLRVAAVDSERVQFHQLARVVFVDAAPLLLWSKRTTGVWTDALKIIKVEQHRRT